MLRAAALRRGLSTSQSKRVVVVDGARIPFAMAGTKYKDQMAVDLMRYALRGLLTKTALPVQEVDYVLCGTVVQEPRTSNIAREAAMHAGLPHDIPAHTVSLACVSANAAICQGAEKILSVTQRDFLQFLNLKLRRRRRRGAAPPRRPLHDDQSATRGHRECTRFRDRSFDTGQARRTSSSRAAARRSRTCPFAIRGLLEKGCSVRPKP